MITTKDNVSQFSISIELSGQKKSLSTSFMQIDVSDVVVWVTNENTVTDWNIKKEQSQYCIHRFGYIN